MAHVALSSRSMYVPKHFEQTDQAKLWDLIDAHAFGTLLTVVEGQPTVSHVPFLPVRLLWHSCGSPGLKPFRTATGDGH